MVMKNAVQEDKYKHGLPRKIEILAFKNSYENIQYDSMAIGNKVLNEQGVRKEASYRMQTDGIDDDFNM